MMAESSVVGPGRIVALVSLVAIADLWLSHHFGWGIRNPVFLSAALAGVAGGAGVTSKLLSKPERAAAWEPFRRGLRLAFSPLVLGGLYSLAAVLMLTVSSVVVVPESGESPGTITIQPLDTPSGSSAKELSRGAPLVRFQLVTNPLGRAFRISAPGYVPATFDLFALVGRRVQLGTDLAPSPSVLFRPGTDELAELADGGTITVFSGEPPDTVRLLSAAATARSFLVGREQAIPAAMVADWRLELAASGLGNVNQQAFVIRRWRDPVVLRLQEPLAPGARLFALVLSGIGVPLAEAGVLLGRDRLIDVPMRRIAR